MKVFNFLIIAILSVLLAVLLVNFNLLTFGGAVILVVLPLVLIYPNLYFISFIILRPLMDLAKKQSFGGVNLAAIATIFFVFICGATLLKKENRKQIRQSRFLSTFNKLYLVFIFYCFLPLINSKEKIVSLTDFPRLFAIIVAVNYAVIFFTKEKRNLKLLWLILISALIPLSLGLYQFIFKKGAAELGFQRIMGTFVHPNVYSQYLLLLFFILIYLMVNQRMGLCLKICTYLVFALVGVELFLTYTRGTWIALFVAGAVYISLRTNFLKMLKYFFFGIFIIIVLLPQIQKRFQDINEKKYYRLSSWQWRLKQWNETLESLQEHPFIGSGMGMHEREFKIMAHNDYLRIAFETGCLGLLLYLGILLYILFSALKKVLRAKAPPEINRYKIALALTLSLMIMSLADNLARSTFIILYFFIIIAYFLENKGGNAAARLNYENLAGK